MSQLVIKAREHVKRVSEIGDLDDVRNERLRLSKGQSLPKRPLEGDEDAQAGGVDELHGDTSSTKRGYPSAAKSSNTDLKDAAARRASSPRRMSTETESLTAKRWTLKVGTRVSRRSGMAEHRDSLVGN
jgi:hypothetical protein